MVTPGLNGDGSQDRLVRALVANIQRADLSPIDEARSYQQLIAIGMNRNGIALKLGISAARVAQRLRLLEMEPEIQDLIDAGRLSKDSRLLDALSEVPDGIARVKIAQALAERNASIKSGVEACKRLANTIQAEKIGINDIPAIHIATHHTGSVNRPVWDAIAHVGRIPPWPLMEVCVRDTCDRCSLRDMASETTCKGCALVELLQMMIGSTRSGSSER